MKKQIAVLIAAGMVSFSGLTLAADPAPAAKSVEATLVKVEGEYYMLKDKAGKEFKGHFNDKTKKVGDIKAGKMVDISIDDKGHTTEIKEHMAH